MKIPTARVRYYFGVLFILLLEFAALPSFRQFKVNAEISSCTATVSPGGEMDASGNTDLLFTVTNNDHGHGVTYVQISRPSTNYTINSASVSWDTLSANTNYYSFIGGPINGGYDSSFSLNITASSAGAGDENWIVEVSDDPDRATTRCDGSLSTSIRAPQISISDVNVSNITLNSATISWNSNVPATSVVYYAKAGDNYQSVESSIYETVHSIGLTGLEFDTLYNYHVESVDIFGGTIQSGEAEFLTLTSGPTATPDPDATPTPTRATTSTPTPTSGSSSALSTTSTPYPTPTAIPDVVLPVVTQNPFTVKIFGQSPTVSGHAVDDRGVASVSYTLNNGKSWIIVAGLKNLGNQTVDYSVIPKLGSGVYKIKFRAIDTSGNIGVSPEMEFTIDMDAPKVTLQTDFSKPFVQSPTVSGIATDSQGVSYVEYSLDNGIDWLPVDMLMNNSNQATFSFIPQKLDDGNYDLVTRARDNVGNLSVGIKTVVIIDRLPPRIGAAIFTVGPQIIRPDKNGVMTGMANVSQKITLSAIGGPIKVDIDILKNSTNQIVGSFSLRRNINNGLWTGEINYPEPGLFTMSARAIDGANHFDAKNLGLVKVLPLGLITDVQKHPLPDAFLEVFVFDPDIGSYILWDGTGFGEFNPQKSGLQGEYTLLLPPGSYYLRVKLSGFVTSQSDIFKISETQPVNPEIILKKSSGNHIGSILLPVLPWDVNTFAVTKENSGNLAKTTVNNNISFPHVVLDGVTGKLSLENILGKPLILVLLNSWSPDTAGELKVIEKFKAKNPDNYIGVIFPGETISRVTVFAGRGGYTVPFFADPDNEVAQIFGYITTPTFYFMDKNSVVKNIISGILNESEIVDNSE
jgi:hypothetical protein